MSCFIQIRSNVEEKKAAQKVLHELGFTLSGAVKVFLKKVVQEGRIPFEISTNNSVVRNKTYIGLDKKKPEIQTEKLETKKDPLPKIQTGSFFSKHL